MASSGAAGFTAKALFADHVVYFLRLRLGGPFQFGGGAGELVAQALAVFTHPAGETPPPRRPARPSIRSDVFSARTVSALSRTVISTVWKQLIHRDRDLCLRFAGEKLVQLGSLARLFHKTGFQGNPAAGACGPS